MVSVSITRLPLLMILLLAAMRDFARAKELWYPTWPQNLDDRAMVVYVIFFCFLVVTLTDDIPVGTM